MQWQSEYRRRFPLYAIYALLGGFIGVQVQQRISAVAAKIPLSDVSVSPLSAAVAAVVLAAVLLGLWIYHKAVEKKASGGASFGGAFDRALMSPALMLFLAVLCFRLWYYSNLGGYRLWYDTSSYTEYSANLFLLQADKFRTPIYPYFLKLVGLVSGAPQNTDFFYNSVVAAQQVVSFAGFALFYQTAKKLFKNSFSVYASSLLFGIAPYIIAWDNNILTESLSIFAAVLCLYLMATCLDRPTARSASALGISVIFMIMLRPTFVYLFAVFGVFFAARFVLSAPDRRQMLCGTAALAVSACLALGYCGVNKKENDCFALSSVSGSVNRMYMIIANDIWENDDYPEITEFIREKQNTMTMGDIIIEIVEPLNEQFDYSRLSAYAGDCVADNREVFRNYTADKIFSLTESRMAVNYAEAAGGEMNAFARVDKLLLYFTFPLTFGTAAVLIAAAVIFSVYQLIKNKRVMWCPIGLSAIAFSHIFTSIYGAMAEYARLCAPSAPAIILLALWFADYILSAVKRGRAAAEEYGGAVLFKNTNRSGGKTGDVMVGDESVNEQYAQIGKGMDE